MPTPHTDGAGGGHAYAGRIPASERRPPRRCGRLRPASPRPTSQRRAGGRTWLSEAVDRPSLIVSSPSRRAGETVEEFVTDDDAEPLVVYEEILFDASLGDPLLVVRGPDGTRTRSRSWARSGSALVIDRTGTSSQQPSVCPNSRGIVERRAESSGRWFGRVVYAVDEDGRTVLVEAWVPAEHLEPSDG